MEEGERSFVACLAFLGEVLVTQDGERVDGNLSAPTVDLPRQGPGQVTGEAVMVTDSLYAVLHPVVLSGTGEVICAAIHATYPPSKHGSLALGSCAAGVCNYGGNRIMLMTAFGRLSQGPPVLVMGNKSRPPYCLGDIECRVSVSLALTSCLYLPVPGSA